MFLLSDTASWITGKSSMSTAATVCGADPTCRRCCRSSGLTACAEWSEGWRAACVRNRSSPARGRVGVGLPPPAAVGKGGHHHRRPRRRDDRDGRPCLAGARDQPSPILLPAERISAPVFCGTPGMSWCEWKGRGGSLADLVTPARVATRATWSYRHRLRFFDRSRRRRRGHGRTGGPLHGRRRAVVPQPGGFYGGWITSQVVGPFKGGGPGTGGSAGRVVPGRWRGDRRNTVETYHCRVSETPADILVDVRRGNTSPAMPENRRWTSIPPPPHGC